MTRSLFLAIALASLSGVPTVNSARNSSSLRPTASFTVSCAVGSRQCSFNGAGSDSSATGRIVSYVWEWGSSSESHTTPTATNTFPAGSWCVKLYVVDASGQMGASSRQITVPYVAGTQATPCTPVKPDTVTIQLPPVHDTIAISAAIPQILPGEANITIDTLRLSYGLPTLVFRFQVLGALNRRADGTTAVYVAPASCLNANPVGLCLQPLKFLGVYPDQTSAAKSLDALTPIHWGP